MAQHPRVRPRVALEERVDRVKHPPRQPLPLDGEGAAEKRAWSWKDLDPAARAALIALAVFWVALPLAGFLGPMLGWPWGLGFLGLAASSLKIALLLGSDE